MSETKSKHRISFFLKVLLLLNFIAVLLLLVSYSAAYINPNILSIISLAGLAYPIILTVNIIFILIWLFTKKRFALLSLIAVLLGWNHLGRLVQFNSEKDVDTESKVIKVLSYNIQNFIKLNTSSTKYVTNFENQSKIIQFIQKQDADIICIQELLNDRKGFNKFPSELGKKLNCPNYYFINYYQRSSKTKIDAIAIFTKYPIIDKDFIVYEEKTIGIFTDLLINHDTIRLYNLHLASIRFKREDYDFISDIASQQDQENIKSGSKAIISKIKTAFIKRGYQVDILSEHISESPYPVIICGDFNDTPSSYVYRVISKERNDAFVESGKGFGNTYAGENFPSLRIDYIFYDDSFSSLNFKRHKINLSDHYPVSCFLLNK